MYDALVEKLKIKDYRAKRKIRKKNSDLIKKNRILKTFIYSNKMSKNI